MKFQSCLMMQANFQQRQPAESDIRSLIELLQATRFHDLEQRTKAMVAHFPGHGLLYKILGAALQMQGLPCLNELRHATQLMPDDAELCSNLGNMLRSVGHMQDARTYLEQALSLEPGYAYALYNLALLHLDCQRYRQAEQCLRRALAIDTLASPLHLTLGDTLQKRGRQREALLSLQRALVIDPGMPDAHMEMGNLFADSGQWHPATKSYRRTLLIQPDHVDAHCNLGMVLVELERSNEAITHLLSALAIAPLHAQAHNNLGNAYYIQGQFSDAITRYRNALIIETGYTEAYANLGNVLELTGELDTAVILSKRALAINPYYNKAHNNLGNALRGLGHVGEAIGSFEHALSLAPDNAETRLNYSFALLQKGDFARGWREYEYRWQTKVQGRMPELGIAQWRGDGEIHGKTILLYAEQGLGDSIQFMRYADLLAKRGAIVYATVPENLLALARSCPGISAAWRLQDASQALQASPRAEWICPMMSLPLACRTELTSIPAAIPYFHGSEATINRWRALLDAIPCNVGNPQALRVGLVWAGNPRNHLPLSNAIDRQRSMRFEQMRPLLEVPDIDFFSLQVGDTSPINTYEKRLIDLTDQIRTFEDTAALISLLDLVISVDTSVAHLAGAVGKPVWMLNRFNTCWRWMSERNDSPWYPTMKIYRQASSGNWQGVIEQVRLDLQILAQRTSKN